MSRPRSENEVVSVRVSLDMRAPGVTVGTGNRRTKRTLRRTQPLPHYAAVPTPRHRQIRVGRTSLRGAAHPHPYRALRRNTGVGTDVTCGPAVGVEGRVR